MKDYHFKITRTFKHNFRALPKEKRLIARKVFEKFKANPFHRSLHTHKIDKLSKASKMPIYSSWIMPDLRVIFTVRGNVVTSLDIGDHQMYR